MLYRARQLLQYSDEELTGKRGYDLIHPDDSNYYSAAHQERTSILRYRCILLSLSLSLSLCTAETQPRVGCPLPRRPVLSHVKLHKICTTQKTIEV